MHRCKACLTCWLSLVRLTKLWFRNRLRCCPGFSQERVNFHQKPEGTQPCQLTETGQKEQGIPYHVPPCWVPGEKLIVAQELVGHWVVRVTVCISLFVLCILLISVIVVTVPFVCCSVKLLTRFFAFFFPFSSPPQHGEGRWSDCMALLLPTMTKLQQLSSLNFTLTKKSLILKPKALNILLYDEEYVSVICL